MIPGSKLFHGIRRDEVSGCRFLMAVCFAVFLPVALLARLSGWRWRPWPPGPNGYGSVVKETRSIASTIAGVVFST
ncbi:MAG TPA: hypothetical protein VF389_01115 [Woeseiaceae bacterium]